MLREVRPVLAAAVLACLCLVGCGGGGDPKYESTWTKSVPDTDCPDFIHAMDDQQRFAFAFGRLLVYRTPTEQTFIPTDKYPSDELVREYAADVIIACATVTPDQTLSTLNDLCVATGEAYNNHEAKYRR